MANTKPELRSKADKRVIEYVSTSSLTPYARNSRTHSPQQVKQIAASIKEFGFTNPVLIDESNGIIAGHGRVMAAEHLQLAEVPCIRLEYLTETQKRAYVIADNKLALNAAWDEELLKIELDELDALDFNLSLLGFDLKDLSEAMAFDVPNEENPYSQKIAAPTYEPKGEKPLINLLYDDTKHKALIAEINNSSLPSQEKEFLMLAASRHIVFDYSQIANYYAHADIEAQELMEKSALVIIDFNKAIEQGLVTLSKEINDLIEHESTEE